MDYKCIYLRLEKRSSLKINILRDRAGVARWAHNPKVGCSNHSPATKKPQFLLGLFYLPFNQPVMLILLWFVTKLHVPINYF